MVDKGQPIWLNNEIVKNVLRYFIRNINRQPVEKREKNLYLSTSSSILKELIQPQSPGDDELLWTAIELAIEDGVFEIKEGKRQHWEPVYLNARLKFNTDFEENVRGWLGMQRPAEKSAWELALDDVPIEINSELLLKSPILVKGKSSEEVVKAIVSMRKGILDLNEPLTLRQLSARYFWGASKTLDNRNEDWVREVLNVDSSLIVSRAVHISVLLPKVNCNGLLFIENQDTFDRFCHLSYTPDNFAVVFLSGFKGTATRVRSREGGRLFFNGDVDKDVVEHFKDLWFSNADIDTKFWGDLDFAGLNIAIALRRIFPSLQWYSRGYDEMVRLVKIGVGHDFNHHTKGNQSIPDEDDLWDEGIGYMSAIKEAKLFLDQEAVFFNKKEFFD